MDVFPGLRGLAAAILLASTTLSACGNRYDLETERGRRARIDDANFHLSKGACSSALAAIWPLYESKHADDEVRLVTASAYACSGTFNLLTLAGNIANTSNPFQALALSLRNKPNDGARAAMYRAHDVLTQNGAVMGANLRSPAVNSYMVFIQLGIIGTVIRNYGSPALDGTQGADLVYPVGSNPAGKMDHEDACALAASLGHIVDSFVHSGLQDEAIKELTDDLETLCVDRTGHSCSVLSQSRTACVSLPAAELAASLVVVGVNAAW